MTAAALLRKLESFDIVNEIYKCFDENKAELEYLNRKQWEDGRKADGSKTEKYQSPEYARFKVEMNPEAGGTMDFMLSHDLERNLKVTREGGDLLFDSGDWKADSLKARFGENIFGLSPDSKGQAAQIINDALLTEIETRIGL